MQYLCKIWRQKLRRVAREDASANAAHARRLADAPAPHWLSVDGPRTRPAPPGSETT